MLTSSSNTHYLRPEYLSPLQGSSIELDAKKSPLALLAQTCSSIGADMSSKSSISSSEKSKQGKSSPGAKSPAANTTPTDTDKNNTSSSFKPYEKKIKEETDDRLSPKRATPGARSPTGSVGNPPGERASSRGSDSGRCSSRTHEPPTSSPGGSTRAASPITPKTSPSSLHSLHSLGDLSKDPLAAYRLAPSLYPHLALSLDPMLGAAGLSALTAKVPTSCASSNPSLSSPYVGYARVKTSSGAETVIPVCRDPYCTGCSINAHAAQVVNGTCPPACSQCAQVQAHTKSLSASLPGLVPTLPATASLRSGLYPPPGLVGGSHQPYVCNWIASDNYCGKRFASSEDLLQHLRTHTNLSTSDSSPSSLPLHAAAAAASLHAHPLLAGHLPRGYPTPPLSPLSAARYHPYHKSALLAAAAHLPPTTPLPPAFSALSGLVPHPLSAYYSPYSLYARGLHS